MMADAVSNGKKDRELVVPMHHSLTDYYDSPHSDVVQVYSVLWPDRDSRKVVLSLASWSIKRMKKICVPTDLHWALFFVVPLKRSFCPLFGPF